MDLNIIAETNGVNTECLGNIIQRAFDFGFECIAINTIIDSSNLSGKNIVIPEPKVVKFEGKPGRKFRILSRLTAVIEDGIHVHHLMRSPVTKKYDILALQPVGEKILHHVCSSLDVDIISLNMTEDLGFSLKKSHIAPAIQKNMCFEILYAPCLRSQTSKRSVISNSLLLVDVSGGKNVIISSGAIKPLELRSPEDIANLGILFGFKMDQAITAVRKTALVTLSHSATRRKTGCGFVSITGIYNLPKHQGWIINACKVPKISAVAKDMEDKKKRKIDETNLVSDDVTKKQKLTDDA